MPRVKQPASVIAVENAFGRSCRGLDPLRPGARLLLACSAGGDSMTLLDLAARRAGRARWELAVLHVDHRQRAESTDEARFVMEQVEGYGLECFVERLPDDLVAASPLSEEVMREARLERLRAVAKHWDARAVLLAHQADDRAETFLIRLLAGSGPTGLASIRAVERFGGLTLVRPLLGGRRGQMREYLRARGIDWREDPTNLDQAGKRAWVRHTVLPLMREKIGLDPTERIAGAAALIEEEATVLTEAARILLGRMRCEPPQPAGDRLDLSHPCWTEAGPLLRRQLLRQWLWDMRRRPHPPGMRTVNEALAFVEQARPGAELRTIERIHVVHCKDSLLAFGPEVDPPARHAAAAPYLRRPPSQKKRGQAKSRTAKSRGG